MKHLEQIKEQILKDLEPYTRKPKLTAVDVEALKNMTGIVKNICKIEKESQEGYSMDSGMRRGWTVEPYSGYPQGQSYNQGGGQSYAQPNQYSQTMDRGYSERRYSMDGGERHMIKQLEGMMAGANPREKDIIKRCLEEMEG